MEHHGFTSLTVFPPYLLYLMIISATQSPRSNKIVESETVKLPAATSSPEERSQTKTQSSRKIQSRFLPGSWIAIYIYVVEIRHSRSCFVTTRAILSTSSEISPSTRTLPRAMAVTWLNRICHMQGFRMRYNFSNQSTRGHTL